MWSSKVVDSDKSMTASRSSKNGRKAGGAARRTKAMIEREKEAKEGHERGWTQQGVRRVSGGRWSTRWRGMLALIPTT